MKNSKKKNREDYSAGRKKKKSDFSPIGYEELLQRWIHPDNLSKKPAHVFGADSFPSSTAGINFSKPYGLIVGDNADAVSVIARQLRNLEIPFAESSIASCFELYEFDEHDGVIVFMVLNPEESLGDLTLLRRAREHFAAVPVLVFDTAERSPEEMELLQKIAVLRITKSHDDKVLQGLILVAGRIKRLMFENSMIRQSLSIPHTPFRLQGKSAGIRKLLEEIEQAAYLESPVALAGESGTKKPFVAQLIHLGSLRAKYPFDLMSLDTFPLECVKLYLCGAAPGYNPLYPGGLLGKLSLMHRGTLFIDQVNRLQRPEQKILLQFLKTRTFQFEGSEQATFANVRIITSYHSDLLREVDLGVFDPELYELLHARTIYVPSFREVKADIEEFFQVSASWAALVNGLPVPAFDRSAIEKLMAYSWPDNSSEFETVVQRAVLCDTDGVIRDDDIHLGLYASQNVAPTKKTWGLAGMTMAETQKQLILETLEHCNGNKSQAAKMLKISEKTLYNKLAAYELE